MLLQHQQLTEGITPPEIPVDAPYELEPDPLGRFRCWGILLATPGFYYHGTWVDCDGDDLEGLKAHQERLLSMGYEAPVLILHDEEALEGRRAGHVGVLEIVPGREDKDTLYLLAALTLYDPRARERKERGEYRYLSAGVGPYQDDTDYSAPWGVYEVSIVPRPWQKRLGPTHLLHEDTMKPKIKTGEPEPTQTPPPPAAVAEPPAAPAPPEPPPAVEPPEADDAAAIISGLVAEVASLAGRIAALEAAAAPAVVEPPAPPAPPEPSMLGEVARGLGLSEVQIKGIQAAAKTDPKAALGLLLAGASKAPATPNTSGYQTTQTEAGGTPSTGPTTKREVWAACLAEAKGDAVAAQALYATRSNHLTT